MSSPSVPDTGMLVNKTFPRIPTTCVYRPSGIGNATIRSSIPSTSMATGFAFGGSAVSLPSRRAACFFSASRFAFASLGGTSSFFFDGSPNPRGCGMNGDGSSALRVTRWGRIALGKL
jgi:hypothetical protein